LHLFLYAIFLQDYSKFWVEINYTASAYDELNMCKYQLQVVPSVDIEKESNLQIYDFEIADTLHELVLQQEMAEKEFVRLKGSLKYLHHLKEKDSTEPEICPICKQVPEERVSYWLNFG
jgi:E3 ubiquitin-protein ligase SHPRH